MPRRSYELTLALGAVVLIAVVYILLARHGPPRASGLAGHALGVLGTLMMLSTELLYSLRKRSRRRGPGRLSTWLQAHIFTGIVGTTLVLLHSAWQFHGLAGVLALLAVVVVASGFVGRYIYTAVPRTAQGAIVELRELQQQIMLADGALQAGLAGAPAAAAALAVPAALTLPAAYPRGRAPAQAPGAGHEVRAVLARPWLRWQYDRQMRRQMHRLDAAGRPQAQALRELLDRRYRLESQARSLETARRMLALWHTIHIPLSTALFTLAFVHAGAALFYATLLR